MPKKLVVIEGENTSEKVILFAALVSLDNNTNNDCIDYQAIIEGLRRTKPSYPLIHFYNYDEDDYPESLFDIIVEKAFTSIK